MKAYISLLTKTILTFLLVQGAMVVAVPVVLGWLFPIGLWPDGLIWLRWTGLLVLPLGLIPILWAEALFVFVGKGTPLPIEPPKEFVISGPFRFVRNPMYLGLLTLIIGMALLLDRLVVLGYAGVFLAGVTVFLLVFEEPQLRRRFGASYQEFLEHVPRWIPRLRGYHPPGGG